MTYKARIAVKMLQRIGIVIGCFVAYIALAVAIGFGIDWLFGIGLESSMQIGLFAPMLIVGAAMLLFLAWDSSRDAVNKEDADIMRALRYTSRDDE